jgi:SPOR domain
MARPLAVKIVTAIHGGWKLSARFDARAHAYEERARGSGTIYGLMLVVALAFGGFVWRIYSAPAPPLIAAQAGPYKVAPPSEAGADAGERPEPGDAGSAAAEAAPMDSPRAGEGAFVAQLASLQSQAAVEQAWVRFRARAPELFAPARLDVQRADLGARGIYYRVRAGYFASRDQAAQFCNQIREMGQDCLPAPR